MHIKKETVENKLRSRELTYCKQHDKVMHLTKVSNFVCSDE